MNINQAIAAAKKDLAPVQGEDHTARVAARAYSILSGRNEANALSYIAAAGMYEPLNEFVGDLIQQLAH